MQSYAQHQFNLVLRSQALRIQDFVRYDVSNANRHVHAHRIASDIKYIIENILTYPADER